MGYIIAVARLRRRARRRGDRRAGGAAGEPRADRARRRRASCSGSGAGAGRGWRRSRSALVLWAAADRPDILIADNGRLFGIRTDAGRLLSSAEGNGYAAESWLENDGDLASQAEAYARGGLVAAQEPDRDRGAGARAGCSMSAPSDAVDGRGGLRRGGDPDRAELARRRRTGAASSSAASGCAATGRWRSGSRRTGSEVEGARSREPRPALDRDPAPPQARTLARKRVPRRRSAAVRAPISGATCATGADGHAELAGPAASSLRRVVAASPRAPRHAAEPSLRGSASGRGQ